MNYPDAKLLATRHIKSNKYPHLHRRILKPTEKINSIHPYAKSVRYSRRCGDKKHKRHYAKRHCPPQEIKKKKKYMPFYEKEEIL